MSDSSNSTSDGRSSNTSSGNASSRKTRVVMLALALVGLSTGLALQRGWLATPQWLALPPEWSPWAPLRVDDPPNFMTQFKLASLPSARAECEPVLSATQLDYVWQPDQPRGEACGIFDAVTIERTAASSVGKPFTLSCRTAVSLALWEEHVVTPAAAEHLGSPVAAIEHFGSYACRNVYGRPSATRSRHATAEALDVAGFVLADGRRIRVLGDWDDETPEAAFLRDVRDGACRFFDGVLSPDYNEAHRDHFHLDRGPYAMCR